VPVNCGASTKNAAATSSGPTAPDDAAPTPRSPRRIAARTPMIPTANAASSVSNALGQEMMPYWASAMSGETNCQLDR
jgi:hypothetical protein